MNVKLIELEKEHIRTLAPIMQNAFNRDSQIHLGTDGGPTGYDNGDYLREWALHPDASSYTILQDDEIIGAVIVWINDSTNENYLSTIFLKSELHGQGIGPIVWEQIETMYPEAKVWRTETPGYSIRNHYFFVNKCKFKIYHLENIDTLRKSSCRLEKIFN